MSSGEILELKTLQQKFDHLTEIAVRQNETIVRMSAALASLTETANALGDTLQALVHSHNSGDQQAVAELLERMSAQARQFKRTEVH